ncbi:helix-turn-helix domain-containing protein [Sodaliphilus pleomorphus]|uniref:helix-turn-helix domain-containing protein n=1 Tax=Sodaliphilus pleomorphus TaxID=2606626 RepID=UPI00240947A6|nr:helix-turn-helix domain-containing protein [Sodaliphilus pleomorphus]MDD6686829.1 helix-turn-helix domain-containing protein [Sodaliphilus pleomorphus]
MSTDLITIAKQCPDLVVSIKLGDLVEANMLLIAETKRELEQMITDQNAETYPSREKVMEMLDVSQATMWRWQKSGYLVPINVGGKRRYRMSDVKRILEGEK